MKICFMKYSIKVENCQLWKKSRFLRVEEMKQSWRGMCSRGVSPRFTLASPCIVIEMTKPLRQPACHARHERAGIVTRGNTLRKHEHDVIFGCPMAKLWPTGHFDP